MEKVCHYAIFRVMPYRDGGEFVYIGIMLVCPEESQLGSRRPPQPALRHATRFAGTRLPPGEFGGANL